MSPAFSVTMKVPLISVAQGLPSGSFRTLQLCFLSSAHAVIAGSPPQAPHGTQASQRQGQVCAGDGALVGSVSSTTASPSPSMDSEQWPEGKMT